MKHWCSDSWGRSLLMAEQKRCEALIPSGYYPNCLQIGMPEADFLQGVAARLRFLVHTNGVSEPDLVSSVLAPGCLEQVRHQIVSKDDSLPFAEKVLDLIVLPHTLDFSDNPHQVLRQVSQILNPEGCVVITGFNLLSVYGLIRGVKHRSNVPPWNGNYFTVRRVQDWLSLLGFDLVGGGMLSYDLPLQKDAYRHKLAFMEYAGDRWWPGLGGVYVIVGKKKEMAFSDKSSKLTNWRKLIPAIAQPAAQNAARQVTKNTTNSEIRLVVDND